MPSDEHRWFSVYVGKGRLALLHPRFEAQASVFDVLAACQHLSLAKSAEDLA